METPASVLVPEAVYRPPAAELGEPAALYRLYTPAQATVAMLVGGLLSFGWMVVVNLHRHGERERARSVSIGLLLLCLPWLVFCQVAIWAGMTLWGELMVTALAYWYMSGRQRDMLCVHRWHGGDRCSWWKAIGVSVLGGLIAMPLQMFVGAMLFPERLAALKALL